MTADVDHDLATAPTLAAWLGVTAKTVRELVADRFPQAIAAVAGLHDDREVRDTLAAAGNLVAGNLVVGNGDAGNG